MTTTTTATDTDLGGSERLPDLAEVIRAAIASSLVAVRTAIPARVVKVHTTTAGAQLKVDVKILVKQGRLNEDEQRIADSLPVITNVPVALPGAGGYRATFPLVAGADGTIVLLVFAERSLDKWLTGRGGEVDPEIDHLHHLADAIAILELHPFGAPLTSWPTDHATLGKDDGTQLHMHDAVMTVADDEAAAGFVARAEKVLTELQRQQTHFAALEAVLTGSTINTAVAGLPDLLQIALKAAIVAAPYPSPASVAAAQLKAK